jgi:hypothetical protein
MPQGIPRTIGVSKFKEYCVDDAEFARIQVRFMERMRSEHTEATAFEPSPEEQEMMQQGVPFLNGGFDTQSLGAFNKHTGAMIRERDSHLEDIDSAVRHAWALHQENPERVPVPTPDIVRKYYCGLASYPDDSIQDRIDYCAALCKYLEKQHGLHPKSPTMGSSSSKERPSHRKRTRLHAKRR